MREGMVKNWGERDSGREWERERERGGGTKKEGKRE